jgi:hypothetical protein
MTTINVMKPLRDQIRRVRIKAGYSLYADLIAQAMAAFELLIDHARDGGTVVLRSKDGQERELLMAVPAVERDMKVWPIKNGTCPIDHPYGSELVWFVPMGSHQRCRPAPTERSGQNVACGHPYGFDGS